MTKSTRKLVTSRLRRAAQLEAYKPGTIRNTPMLHAFVDAIAR